MEIILWIAGILSLLIILSLATLYIGMLGVIIIQEEKEYNETKDE